jgi:hypothetical protein
MKPGEVPNHGCLAFESFRCVSPEFIIKLSVFKAPSRHDSAQRALAATYEEEVTPA